jgi:hypothetical protein
VPDGLTEVAGRILRGVEGILAAPVLADDDPLSALRGSAEVQTHAGDLVAAAVERARTAGCTWQQIGDVLGISRQAAFQRFGRPIDPRTGQAMNTTPLPAAAGLAEAVIDDLANGRWSAVTDRFDTKVAELLSAEGLAAAWAHVIGTAGAYESNGPVQVRRAADFTVTTTPLAFEAGDFVARITFRDDRTIAGLYLVPPDHAK